MFTSPSLRHALSWRARCACVRGTLQEQAAQLAKDATAAKEAAAKEAACAREARREKADALAALARASAEATELRAEATELRGGAGAAAEALLVELEQVRGCVWGVWG